MCMDEEKLELESEPNQKLIELSTMNWVNRLCRENNVELIFFLQKNKDITYHYDSAYYHVERLDKLLNERKKIYVKSLPTVLEEKKKPIGTNNFDFYEFDSFVLSVKSCLNSLAVFFINNCLNKDSNTKWVSIKDFYSKIDRNKFKESEDVQQIFLKNKNWIISLNDKRTNIAHLSPASLPSHWTLKSIMEKKFTLIFYDKEVDILDYSIDSLKHMKSLIIDLFTVFFKK